MTVAEPEQLARLLDSIADAVARRVLDELAALLARTTPPRSSSLVDRRELARALSVSIATVTRMTGEGMPHLFVGASPRYAVDEVRAWLAERGRRATQAAAAKRDARETMPGVRLLSRRAK